MTLCVNCKGIPSATPSAATKNLSTHRRISVDKKCYGLARFGRQKAVVNRKYGHDPQWVAGSNPARPTNCFVEFPSNLGAEARPTTSIVSIIVSKFRNLVALRIGT